MFGEMKLRVVSLFKMAHNIKTCEKSKWLRKEALIAIEEWEAGGAEREEGILHGILTKIEHLHSNAEYQIYTYHTKTCIICDVRQTKEA